MATLGRAMVERFTSKAAGGADPVSAAAGARQALAWAHTARFVTSASQLDQLPVSELPEFAFVGRSNAGKSSAINALTQRRSLAFASKTPGRTQHLNLFALGPKDAPNALFVDLPGYGYAAVARGAKLRWQKVMADYLEVRRGLAGLVLLVDARLGVTELDDRLLEFVAPRVRCGAVRLLVLLTKIDKLNRSDAQAAVGKAQTILGGRVIDSADIQLATFSVLKGTGVADVAELLHGWAVPSAAPDPPPRPD
jgi:GTP-binding protein